MTDKIITLDDKFSTGEPTVQLLSTWGRNGKLLREKTSLHKVAAINSPAIDYADTVEPIPGKTIVLIIGLGDHETYGPNRNGDGFPSEPMPGKVEPEEVLTKHYKSYEDAHVFEHHANDDPAKAIGKVLKAFWNPHMRRVEVIQDFDHEKAPHLLERLADGDLLATSMGCRIKFDVCSICGNKAPTRKDYCDHLKYEMNRIYPDGKQACALNPSPKFFDSSFVIRPADRTGYMIKKVARESLPYEVKTSSYELGGIAADLKEKAANLRKAADIEKLLRGEPVASVSCLDKGDAKLIKKYNEEVLPPPEERDSDGVVKVMLTFKPSEIMGTSEAEGVPLGIQELLKYFLGKMEGGDPTSSCNCDAATVKSASRHVEPILRMFSNYPRFFDELTKSAGLLDLKYNEKLANSLGPFTPETVTEDYIGRNVLPAGLRPNERALTDTLTYTDPNTGQKYVTNYGIVQNTHDALVEKGLKDKAVNSAGYLGGSALLGTAALGMGLSRRFGKIPAIAAGLGSAGLGALGVGEAMKPTPIAGPTITTDRGERISGWTEMTPKYGSSTAPEIAFTIKRAYDGGCTPLSEEHINLLNQAIKTAEIHDEYSALLGPTLNLDKVGQIIGISIVEAR